MTVAGFVEDRGIPAPLLFTVEHKPATKGSMKAAYRRGRIRMWEDVQGSTAFRDAVAWSARAARASAPGYPLTGPVEVQIVCAFVKPPSYPKRRRCWPVTRGSGDIDKLERNVFDALVDAEIIGDDSQVCRVIADKDYAGHGVAAAFTGAGARIMVRPHPDAEVVAPELAG